MNWQCYDVMGHTVRSVANASQTASDLNSVANPCNAGYQASSAPDTDLISTSSYDAAGRLTQSVDPLGRITHFLYNNQGRQIASIRNYVTGVFDPSKPDQ